MNEKHTHWLTDAINQSHAGTVALDALSGSFGSISGWQWLHRNLGLEYSFIATAVAKAFDLTTVDVRHLKPVSSNPFTEKFCRKVGVFPFDLTVVPAVIATYDPRLSPDQHQQIRFLLGRDFELAIVCPDDLDTALTFLYSTAQEKVASKSVDLGLSLDNESDTVQLMKAIFREAIERRASDIHIHPFVGGAAIRFRVDGVMIRIATLPQKALAGLANYLNVQANLDANPLIPQDGRLSVKLGTRHFDVRLSLLPAFDGMRIVCRLLEQGKQFSLLQSGFSVSDLQMLKRLIDWGTGIVLMTGPTGSGKTSTLYALLAEMNTADVNIITLEDPVEYVLPGISQIQVNKVQGRSFADTLRSILRQDPDVVLIGEIRDAETAQVATQASLTGHLVLSTLHTNDAMATIPRLLDLKIDPAILADTLIGVVSQRLLRKLCTHCKLPVSEPLNAAETEFFRITKEKPAYRANGCEHCGFSGYLGRVPVTEIMEVSPAMRGELLNGVRDVRSLQAANKNYQTFMASGAARWIVSGETTAEDAYRELGLRFWNELASSYATHFSGQAKGLHGSAGAKPAILLLSDRDNLKQAFTQLLPFEIITAANEDLASTVLKSNAAIFALVIDTALLTSDAEQWLRSLRTQLAWSGVPVLFLLPESASDLQKLLHDFNAHTLVLDEHADISALVMTKVTEILRQENT